MTHPTPRFTGRNGNDNYKAWLGDDAQRRLAQATAEANAPELAQRIADAWARAAELRAAGLEFEAAFVEQQAREMEGN